MPPPIEFFRRGDVADAQMHVANAQSSGSAVIGRRVRRAHQILEIELIRRHLDEIVLPAPFFRRPVGIDLDAIAFGVVEIDRLGHEMVGRARDRRAVRRHLQHPPRQIGARRHQEGGVVEPGSAVVVRHVRRVVPRVRERPPRRPPTARRRSGALDHRQTEDIAIKGGDAIEIAHGEADRADMDRCAAGEGRNGRRIGGVHGCYIGPSAIRRNRRWPCRE